MNPTIEVQTRYLEPPGFGDRVLAFQVAEQIYRGGADVIFPAAGASGEGVFEAALQLSDELDRHLWAVGVDTDVYEEIDPSDPWRPHILTSVLKRYDRAVYALLEEHDRGEFTPGARHLDLASGAVDLAYSGGFIDDIRPEIDDLRQRVISGEIDVPTIPADKQDEAAELGIAPAPPG